MTLAYTLNNTRSPHAHRLIETFERLRKPTVSLTAPGHPVMAYSGYPAGELNILRLMCDMRDGAEVRTEFQHPSNSKELDPAIVLHGVHRDAAEDVARRASHPPLICPFRVHLLVGTESREQLESNISGRQMALHRRIEESAEWELVRSTDPARVRRFYTEMHLPTMTERHGEAQRTETVGTALAIVKQGALFEVHRNGQWVAGVICTQEPEVLTARLIGVSGGDPALYEAGALKMVYYLLLDHAASTPGLKHTDLYGTEAMIAKGIFQWKRRLGAYPSLPNTHWKWKRLVWDIKKDTPAVRDLLQRCPLLLMEENGFRPVYFYDDQRRVNKSISSKCTHLPPPEHLHMDEFLAETSTPTTAEETDVSPHLHSSDQTT